jgi:hypothetical protein
MFSNTIEVARDQASRPQKSSDINFSLFQTHIPRQRSHDGYICHVVRTVYFYKYCPLILVPPTVGKCDKGQMNHHCLLIQ